MTELDVVDAANCPHCRAEVEGDELNALATTAAEEAVLVCPECDTMLGGAMGDGMFASLAGTLLAEDVDDAPAVTEALIDVLDADGRDDVDDESIELLDDRMGGAEVTIN